MAEVPRGTHLKRGIVASVGIHLAALAVLGRFAFHPDAPAPEPFRAYLEIRLSTKPAPPPPDGSARDEFPAPAYSTADSAAGESAAAEEAPLADPAPSPAVEASSARDELDTPAGEVAGAPPDEAPATAGAETSRSDGTPGMSVTALQSSISGFMQGYRGELKQEWLSECERYKNRHGTRECLAEDPVALRAPRYYLQDDEYDTLVGAGDPLYAMFQNTVNARNREVLRGEGTLALAGTGPSLLGVALSILGKGSLTAYGAGSRFNFTEDEPGRPEQDEEAEDRGFEIRGPLFRPD